MNNIIISLVYYGNKFNVLKDQILLLDVTRYIDTNRQIDIRGGRRKVGIHMIENMGLDRVVHQTQYVTIKIPNRLL